jgi:hypothetical protein
MIIANAGSAEPDYPPNQEIASGRLGVVFAGSHWVFYCGGRDPSPERSGCSGMRKSAGWVKDFGGSVDLFIDEPEGDHGGFHRNPENVRKALDAFGEQSRSMNNW